MKGHRCRKPSALTGPTEVRRRRVDFAEFPRLEARLEPAEGAREPGELGKIDAAPADLGGTRQRAGFPATVTLHRQP